MTQDFVPGSIRVLGDSASQWARAHPTFYLGNGESRREQIELHLLRGARAVGAIDIELIRCGAWSVLGSTRDWFRERRFPLLDDEAFEQPRAFPELGANSVQGEFVVGAFADAALVQNSRGIRTVRGDGIDGADALEILRNHPEWVRAVAFSLTES